MKYVVTLLFCFVLCSLQAQPDQDRMKRDIEVAENILASLLQETYGEASTSISFFGNESKVQGAYLDDFGVLFTIARHFEFATLAWDAPKVSGNGDEDVTIVIPDRRVIKGRVSGISVADSASRKMHFTEMVETFVTDYGYLLRQVPSDEKIMIRYGSQVNRTGFRGNLVIAGTEMNVQVYSAAVIKSDLEAYEKEKISRDQLVDRIKYTTEGDEKGEEARDMKLLSSIFSRLYQQDLSETFFMHRAPGYEHIDGLGVVLYFNMSSKYQSYPAAFAPLIQYKREGNFRVVVPDGDNDLLDTDEASEKVDSAYPQFLTGLKENIIEYGGIAKDLKENEALIFRIQFFNCDDCEVVPEEIEITVKGSTLIAYRQGKISLQNAIGQMDVK